jgi:hypothetical protein
MTPTTTPTDSNDHHGGFPDWSETAKVAHLIEHGNTLRTLRRLSDDELVLLHNASHDGGRLDMPEAPDLPALAERATKLAAGLREHIAAGRWGEAFAAADWLIDLGDEIHSHIWAAHPDARPETW